jgi:hypothetical protein
MSKQKIRIGAGCGMSDDRIPPAVERGAGDYLCCECLAERTIAHEALDRARDPRHGYTLTMLERMKAVLPPSLARDVRIALNKLTSERVLAAYQHLTQGPVRRCELPRLRALNFVIENVLGGGDARSLAIDPHGKSLSALILTIELPD